MSKITVLLPVYNGAKYLAEAIDSVLKQTFGDFTLLIINDASTDDSEKVIQQFSDQRIMYVRNPINLGLIATLNKGLKLCKTEFIARMDQDDCSLPERFEIQLRYFFKNPAAAVVASPILGITPGGRKRDHWDLDISTQTPEAIKKRMALQNCISHPTVLMRSEIIQSYLYSASQIGSEDWDLWLRLLRDGHQIVKTKEVLLHYRIHPQSVTYLYRQKQHTQIKSALVKLRFFGDSLRHVKLNGFVLRSLFSVSKDLFYFLRKAGIPSAARQIKWFFSISPLEAKKQYQLLVKTLAGHQSRYFFFFPYSHLGGAEKVHAAITKLMAHRKPFVFITGLDDHTPWIEQFGSEQKVLRIAAALYHPLYARLSREALLGKIRSVDAPVLLGANNRFFEEIIPAMSSSSKVVDLTHDFDYEKNRSEAIESLAAWLRCDKRIFISSNTLERCRKFYSNNFTDLEDEQKLQLIMNGVPSPAVSTERHFSAPLTVLYAGRDTAEKRVELIFEIAQKCQELQLPYKFIFAGPIHQRLPEKDFRNVEYRGVITDNEGLAELYAQSHLCIITSVSEGFPMSLMEAMMSGCVPLSTAVGDIPNHIIHGENGFLTKNTEDLDVVSDLVQQLRVFQEAPALLEKASIAARAYAEEHFSLEAFKRGWKGVLEDVGDTL